jgi:hypothetical protein
VDEGWVIRFYGSTSLTTAIIAGVISQMVGHPRSDDRTVDVLKVC